MSLPDVLLGFSVVSLFWIVPIAILLAAAALQRPHIWSLTLMALLAIGIGLLEIAYIVAAVDAVLGYPIAKDLTQVGFRLAAIVIAVFPPLFWYVYITGRFRDGSE
jgi:hypothetical protein